MQGLLRVRGFTQDDAHIFCTPDQIEDEIVSCLEFAIDVLKTFGFDEYEAELSTWDGGKSGKYDGAPELWQLGENALKRAAERLKLKVTLMPDEAAFYGPKIDMKLLDALGGQWELSPGPMGGVPESISISTFQPSSAWNAGPRMEESTSLGHVFNLPAKFGLEYVAE